MTYGVSEFGKVGYSNIDPRQLQKFMRMPEFVQSLTTEQRSGIAKRIITAKWSPEERIVYDAVAEGYTTLDTLPVATGLTDTQIRSALSKLTEKGYIKSFGVEIESKKLAL